MIFSLSSEGISSYKGPADRVRASPQLTCLALSKSLAGFAGEVSLQQLASDSPSLRMGNCLEDPRHPSANLLSCRGEVRGRVWSLSPLSSPPQPAGTRLERIQQLGVYGEDPGKSLSSRWQVTSPHFPSLVSLQWVTQKGAHA